jgi:hypothetical protein
MRRSVLFGCLLLFGRAATGIAQTPLSPEFRANTQGALPQVDQVVAVSHNGELLVVWQSIGLWGQWFSPDGQPIGRNRVLQFSLSQPFGAAACAGPTGGVSVFFRKTAWQEGWDTLISREVGADGTWLGSRNSLASLQQLRPRFIRPLPQGGYVVALIGSRQHRNEARSFLLFTDAQGKVTSGPSPVYPARRSEQYVDGLAVSPSGNFLITWTDAGAHQSRVLTQLFSPQGHPLHSPVQIHENVPGVQFVGRVAALGDRGYVVVWDDGDVAGSVDIKMRFVAPDGSLQSPVLRVDDEPSFRHMGKDIAADAAGNFFVVWQAGAPTGTPGRGWDVWGRLFRPDGRPVGPSQVLSTYTASDQTEPIVAAGANGTFVVVWQSYGQDGDAEGIFGRVFAAAPPDDAGSH